MINFNKNGIFNLKPIEIEKVREDAKGLLVEGEEILMAFKTIRDQLFFTNKRIVAVDVQGIGLKKSYATMPYSKIQFFSVRTAGFELVPDAELFVMFNNGFTANFEFRGRVDIRAIGQAISHYVLD